MRFEEQNIKGVWLIEPKVFADDRGYFMEAYKQAEFEKNIGKISFVQDNESMSSKGVLRGLHYQTGEYSQAKLVRVIQGSVLDVAVDIRRESPSFGQYICVTLSAENKKQLYVPRGMAHGFLVLEDNTIFSYKVDNIYSPEHESCIVWNDYDLNIDWKMPEKEIILSEKDKTGNKLSEASLFD